MKKSTSRRAYGILNAYGDIWSPQTWPDEKSAEEYLEVQRRKYLEMGNHTALSLHKVVQVKISYKFPKETSN
jgi:hypothetical protein